ncbi:HIT-like domain-containing protein [Mycena floridula]|nr:HIT-like domain-containing protein [Mycena floridula]
MNILRSYAQKSPQDLPASILFAHTNTSLTIYDAFPKSIFHFLVLPRPSSQLSLSNLSSLQSLLKCDKTLAKECLDALATDAAAVRTEIETEMRDRYGFVWPIWTGFHAAPSMEHLHLHILSADLISPKMKHKKHYNSFHPSIGFFLDIDDVLSWFDAEPSYFDTMAKLETRQYEKLLKQDLACWRCGDEYSQIPKLKEHLQVEWDEQARREKAKLERKKRLEEKRS